MEASKSLTEGSFGSTPGSCRTHEFSLSAQNTEDQSMLKEIKKIHIN